MPDDGRANPLLSSHEAEQAVLGGLVLADDGFQRLDGRVDVRDFAAEAHRTLFTCMQRLARDGTPLDVVTITAALETAGTLGKVGGLEYLGTLLRECPTARNLEHYAGIVRERSIRRAAAAFGATVDELVASRRPISEVVAEIQRAAAALTDAETGSEASAIREVLPRVVDAIELRSQADPEALAGLSLGLGDLDRMLNGLHAGDLVIIAGRPSMGKTALAMQGALSAARSAAPALIFSLEMSAEKLAQRALAHVGRVSAQAMASGQMQDEDWTRLAEGIGKLTDLPLFIDGSPRLTVDRIRHRARRVKRKFGLALVVVDYLQLMDADGDNRNEQVSTITRGLKLMANELEVPVLALSQLSRRCEDRTDKRPMLSDLRDSGAVEQDADVVLFVYRDEVYHPDGGAKGHAEIIVGKHRDGPIGRVYASFIGEFNRFADTSWRPTPTTAANRQRRGLED